MLWIRAKHCFHRISWYACRNKRTPVAPRLTGVMYDQPSSNLMWPQITYFAKAFLWVPSSTERFGFGNFEIHSRLACPDLATGLRRCHQHRLTSRYSLLDHGRSCNVICHYHSRIHVSCSHRYSVLHVERILAFHQRTCLRSVVIFAMLIVIVGTVERAWRNKETYQLRYW